MTEATMTDADELIKEATYLVDSAREVIVYHRDIPRAKALLEEATAIISRAAEFAKNSRINSQQPSLSHN